MPPTTALRLLLRSPYPTTLLRATFTTTPVLSVKPLPPRLVIPETEIIENFLKGSGPGGQKINKTSSAVQLKHIPTGIVVKCQDTRSRSQNRKVARKLLAERIEDIQLGEGSRTAVKAKEKGRKKASAEKKRRRKYRALAEGKEGEVDGEPEEIEDRVEDGDEEFYDHKRAVEVGEGAQEDAKSSEAIHANPRKG